MTCTRCGSPDLWDDNTWWGCNYCGYAVGPDGGTMIFAKDIAGLAKNLRDIPQPNFLHRQPRLVRYQEDHDVDNE